MNFLILSGGIHAEPDSYAQKGLRTGVLARLRTRNNCLRIHNSDRHENSTLRYA